MKRALSVVLALSPTVGLLLATAFFGPRLLATPPVSEAEKVGATALSGPGAKPDAGDAGAVPDPALTDESYPPLFYLKDGSKVAGVPTFSVVRIATRYGTLEVPTAELLRVHVAARLDPGLEKEIEKHLARLDSDDFDEREDATESLRKIGPPALPALRRAAKSENEETRSRAESLEEEISAAESESPVPAEEMTPSKDENDIVVTTRFTIKGRVLENAFTIRSRYGLLEFPVNDIVGINFKYGAKVSETVDVGGSKTVPSNWVNTKIQLFKGQRLQIRATGHLYVSNYNLTSGPAGCGRSGSYKSFPALALIAKIGKQGKPFLVGVSHRGRAQANGMLYLGVVPYRRYAATGTYKVRVDGGK